MPLPRWLSPAGAAVPAGAPRRVLPETLNVAASVQDLPLAGPGRRALAMAVDLMLVLLLSTWANGPLLAGLTLLVLQRMRQDAGRPTRPWRWRLAAAPWLAWGLYLAVAAGSPAPSTEQDDTEASVQAAVEQAVQAALPPGQQPGLPANASAASAPVDAVAAPIAAAALREAAYRAATTELQRRVKQLEAERDALRLASPLERGRQLLRELGLGWGAALLYFTLLPVWWRGQTPGKRLLQLRTVALTGTPVTAMLALKRYGGYAAGLATGGLGLLQLLWDPNRQAIQDKCAHTVVVDLRALAPSAGPAAVSAPGPR